MHNRMDGGAKGWEPGPGGTGVEEAAAGARRVPGQ